MTSTLTAPATCKSACQTNALGIIRPAGIMIESSNLLELLELAEPSATIMLANAPKSCIALLPAGNSHGSEPHSTPTHTVRASVERHHQRLRGIRRARLQIGFHFRSADMRALGE